MKMFKPHSLFLLIFLVFSVESFSQRIFWTEPNYNRVMVANLSPTGISGATVFRTGLTGPRDLAIDFSGNRLFVADTYGEDIIALNLTTGASISTVITTGAMVYFEDISYSENMDAIYAAMNPDVNGVYMIPANNNNGGGETTLPLGAYGNDYYIGAAFHDGNEQLYIVNSDNQSIYLTDGPSGTNVSTVYSASGLENIALDNKNNKLFFTRNTGSSNEIITSNLNGSGAVVVANVGSGQITSISVYPQFGKIYYIKESVGLYSINMNGTGNALLVSLPGNYGGDVVVQADVTLPVFNILEPADNATNVSVNTNLELNFSEDVQISTTAGTTDETSFRIYKTAGGTPQTILRSSGNISISGNIVTISGITTPDFNTGYHVLAGSKTISDLSGNNWIGITANTGWNFTTTPPVTISRPSGTTCVGAYQTLGDIVITENSPGNFANSGPQTLTLSFNGAGYSFEAGTGSVSYTPSRNIQSASISVTASSITVNYYPEGTNLLDELRISGLKFTTTSGTNPGIDIIRTGGTGLIDGLIANTVVASVYSQPSPSPPSITYPAGTNFCVNDDMSGTMVTASGTGIRWYTDSGLTSEISALAGMTNVTGLDLGIDSSLPASYIYFASQTVGICQSTGANVSLTINALPIANNQTPTICASDANSVNLTTYNSAITSGAPNTNVTWFTDPTLNIPVSNPNSTAVTDGLTLYAKVLNTLTNCYKKSIVTFTVISGPSVDPLNPEICEDAAGSGTALTNLTWQNPSLTGGDGNLSVAWYTVTDIPVSNPSNELVTDGEVFHARVIHNPTTCYSVVNVTFDVKPLPPANAGTDQTLCTTNATLAANAPTGTGLWTISSGSGGSIADPTSPTSTFTGVNGTTYILRWTTSDATTGCSNRDSVNIVFQPSPTIINHPAPQSACEGMPAAFDVSASGATLTYQWQVDQGGGFSNITNGGVYSGATTSQLQISDVTGLNNFRYRATVMSGGFCPVNSNDALLTTDPKPTATNQTKTVCEMIPGSGTATVDLTTMNNAITGSAPNRSVAWFNDPTFTSPVTTPTNVYATNGAVYHAMVVNTLTDCSNSATATIMVNSSPEVTPVPAPKTICNGTSTALTFASVPAGASYTWTVSTNANITGASSSSAPSVFSINQILNNNSTSLQTITYAITPTGSNGCVGTVFNQDVSVQPNPTTANAGADKTICTTSTTLSANTPVAGTGTWTIFSGTGGTITNPSSPTSNFSGSVGVTYVLRWTISNGCPPGSTDDVTIQILAPPTTANAGADVVACNTSGSMQGNSPTVGTGLWTIVSGTGGVLANPSAFNSQFTGVSGNAYVLRWTISNACSSNFDELNINLLSPPTPASAGPDQNNVCAASATLAANTPSVGTGAWTIVNGSGGTITNPSSPTSTFSGTRGVIYTLRWTVTNATCTPSFDEVSVKFALLPSGSGTVSGSTSLCRDATSTYSIGTPVNNATSYDWQVQGGGEIVGSATGSSVSVKALTPGQMTIIATGKNDCGTGGSAQLQVTVSPVPDVTITLPAQAVASKPVSFSFISAGTNPVWNLGNGTTSNATNPEIIYDAPGTYQVSVEVTSPNGCKGTNTVSIEISPLPSLGELAIKNVITANGDNQNDHLIVVGIDEYDDTEVIFLDRWGAEVFRKKNYKNDWDARIGEKYIPSGNYVCVVRYNGKVFSRTVTVIKEQ